MAEKSPNPEDFTLTTEEFAAMNHVKARSVRTRVSRFGSYYGVRD